MTAKENNPNRKKRLRLSAGVRRPQLLDVAVSITADNGLGKAKHADIAKLGGVAVSTVFFYFPTVDDLNNAVIDEVEKVMDLFSSTKVLDFEQDNVLFSLIDNFFQNIDVFVNAHENIIYIYLEWASARRHPMWQRYLAFRAKHLKLVAEVLTLAVKKNEIARDTNIEATAFMITSVSKMVFRMKCFEDSSEAINESYIALKEHVFGRKM